MFRLKIADLIKLGILPLCILIAAILMRNAQGPFYTFQASDPEYVYLTNALNLAGFQKPVHVDHPGTTVQVIGAFVLRIRHTLAPFEFKNLAEDVLSHPESYLHLISITLVGLISLSVLITGIAAFRISEKLLPALLLQSAPLLTVPGIESLKDVSPEPMLIIVALFFSLCVFRLFWQDDLNENRNKYIFSFAVLYALGMATKFTFLPLVAIPLAVLPGSKSKIYFLLGSGLLFLLFILPALFHYQYIIDWVKRLFMHSGNYGHGDANVVNVSLFLPNVVRIFTSEVFFTIFYLLLLIIAVLGTTKYAIGTLRSETCSSGNTNRLLMGLLLTATLQVVMVAKHYRSYYMLPALMLSPLFFIIVFYYSKDMLHRFFLNKFAVAATCLLGAGAIIVHAGLLTNAYHQLVLFKVGSARINAYVKNNYPRAVRIYYYPASTEAYALSFTKEYTNHRRYEAILKSLYADQPVYFLDVINEYFLEDWQNNLSVEEAAAKLRGKKIIFQGGIAINPEVVKRKYGLRLRKVFEVSNNALYGPEVLYEAVLEP